MTVVEPVRSRVGTLAFSLLVSCVVIAVVLFAVVPLVGALG